MDLLDLAMTVFIIAQVVGIFFAVVVFIIGIIWVLWETLVRHR